MSTTSYPIIIWRRLTLGEAVGEFGEREEVWEDIPINAAFAPTSTAEPLTGTVARVVSQAQLILKEPIDYKATDEFLIDGQRWTAEGETGVWWGLFSRRRFGQQILIKRVSG